MRWLNYTFLTSRFISFPYPPFSYLISIPNLNPNAHIDTHKRNTCVLVICTWRGPLHHTIVLIMEAVTRERSCTSLFIVGNGAEVLACLLDTLLTDFCDSNHSIYSELWKPLLCFNNRLDLESLLMLLSPAMDLAFTVSTTM